jgi:hypothetical protein
MNAKSLCILIAAAALMTGCASRPIAYYKADVTEAERKRDTSECLQRALEHNYRLHILLPVAIDREAVGSCLESRGYSLTKP